MKNWQRAAKKNTNQTTVRRLFITLFFWQISLWTPRSKVLGGWTPKTSLTKATFWVGDIHSLEGGNPGPCGDQVQAESFVEICRAKTEEAYRRLGGNVVVQDTWAAVEEGDDRFFLVFFPYILVNQDGEHGRCFEMHFMGCSIAMLVYYRVLNVFEKMSCTKIFVPPGRCCKKLVKPEGNSIRLQQYYAESCASNISPWIAVIETQDLSIWTCSAERLGWCLFISYISIH